jgi:hypothetical protein
MVLRNSVTLASRLERPRVLMSCAWTIFFCDAVFYCFGLDQEFLLGPKEQWPKQALA